MIFLIPFTTDISSRGSDQARLANGLLPGIVKFCDPQEIAIQLIPKNISDLTDELKGRISSLKAHGFKVQIADQSEYLHSSVENIKGSKPRPGWYIQQLLKIAACAKSNTAWNFILDADNILTRPFKVNYLFKNGKAPVQGSTSDYFEKRLKYNCEILNMPFISKGAKFTMRATPQFWHRDISSQLIRHLNKLSSQFNNSDWQQYLWSMRTSHPLLSWTEFSLYWMYAINANLAESFYINKDEELIYDMLSTENDFTAAKNTVGIYKTLFSPQVSIIQSSLNLPESDTSSFQEAIYTAPKQVKPFKKALVSSNYSESLDIEPDKYVNHSNLIELLNGIRPPFWLVSSGGVGSNYLNKILQIPENQLYNVTCHYPYPVHYTGLKGVIYVIGDPVSSVLSQIHTRDHSINIFKNNNVYMDQDVLKDLTISDYANFGRDLLGIESHLNNWLYFAETQEVPCIFCSIKGAVDNSSKLVKFLEHDESISSSIKNNLRIKKTETELKKDQVPDDIIQKLKNIYASHYTLLDKLSEFKTYNTPII